MNRRVPPRAAQLRRTPLKRSGGLKRSPLGHATREQREKVHDLACLVCREGPCDPAHLPARGQVAQVFADDERAVLPLCRRCHTLFDRGELDLSPVLEPHYRTEMAFCVEAMGLFPALRRITGMRWVPEPF